MRALVWEASRARRGNMTAAAKTPSGRAARLIPAGDRDAFGATK